MGLTTCSLIDDVGLCIEEVAAHGENSLLSGLRSERRSCFAAEYYTITLALIPSHHPLALLFSPLTFETTLYLHNLLSRCVLYGIRRMDMEVLFHDTAQMIPLHIKHLLASGNAHYFALDFDNWVSVGDLDAEAVAGQGEHFSLSMRVSGAAAKNCGKKPMSQGRQREWSWW
jgi:hypothetical protein